MGDDHRRYPPPPQEQHAKDKAHRQVPEKAAEALVQVVTAAKHRADRDRRRGVPPKLTQPGQQIAEHDDLLEYAVLQTVKKQDGIPPPHRRKVLGNDVQVEPEMKGGEIQAEPAAADQ